MASDSAQRVPPFLAIAGEVRNLICEYALTSPDGLYSNRTIDMKSPKPLLYTLKNEDWTPPPADHGADNVHTANSEHGTNNVYSTSRGHGASNVHSTSSDHGINIGKPASSDHRVNNGNSASSKHNMGNVWEFNQLKYVNRQMYKETAGIELQHNVVVFLRNNDIEPGPVKQFLDFMRACTPAKSAWPIQAVMCTEGYVQPPKEGTKPWFNETCEVLKLCSTHPNITLYKEIRAFTVGSNPSAVTDTSRQLVSGVIYDFVLRDRPFPQGYMPSDTLADWRNQVEMLYDLWGGKKFLEDTKMANIRYLPADWKKGFDRDAFMDPNKWTSRLQAFMSTPQQRVFWVETVERWYKEGI